MVALGLNSWRQRQAGSESTAEIGPSMIVAAGMVEAWVVMGEKRSLICWWEASSKSHTHPRMLYAPDPSWKSIPVNWNET